MAQNEARTDGSTTDKPCPKINPDDFTALKGIALTLMQFADRILAICDQSETKR